MTQDIFRFWLTLCLLMLGACGGPALWVARTQPGCEAGTGDAELDRERTYLAALLALHSRRYAITSSTPNHTIEAVYASDYQPEKSRSDWVLRIRDDASLEVDTPPERRKVHKRSRLWYDKLALSVVQYQCRELDWLRWEAQNNGLVPVGAPPTSGGSDDSEQAPAVHVAESTDTAEHNARIQTLLNERAAIVLRRPIAFAAVGLGFVVIGATVAIEGAIYSIGGCTDDGFSGRDCSLRDIGRRTMLPIGAAALLVGGVTLGVALPIALGKVRRMREISRELKELRPPTFGVRASQDGLGISLRGTF